MPRKALWTEIAAPWHKNYTTSIQSIDQNIAYLRQEEGHQFILHAATFNHQHWTYYGYWALYQIRHDIMVPRFDELDSVRYLDEVSSYHWSGNIKKKPPFTWANKAIGTFLATEERILRLNYGYVAVRPVADEPGVYVGRHGKETVRYLRFISEHGWFTWCREDAATQYGQESGIL